MLCSKLTRTQSNQLYKDVLNDKDVNAMRMLCQQDLFYLCTIGFKRRDINRDWLYERCREVESQPDEFLDLWAREHYKSTIITYAKTIQDILCDPNITVGIFSHTRPIAKGFLSQIKREFETNDYLKGLFPDVLYANPAKESPRWSEDNGIIVKRSQNPKEATVEAWGLVDGQPTSKHYKLRVYDDVVTLKSVTTPDQIKKTTEAFEMSSNLGADGGSKRIIGTRYHANDTYRTIIDRKMVQLRKYPATDDGTLTGKPVFLTKEALADKLVEQGSYTFSCQMLQDPVADKSMGFKEEWLRFYDSLKNCSEWNYYILVDPAGAKKDESDYTVIAVIALAPDGNYYLVDAVRDRLNLTERTRKLFDFHRKYRPLKVGYEKYGKDSDIEHIEYVMEVENYRFEITPLGGATKKEDRIRKLVPIFENYRFWLPHTQPFIDQEGKYRDFIQEFLADEYTVFPVAVHDDMLDCIARILDKDLKAEFPDEVKPRILSMTNDRNSDILETDYDVLEM